MHTLKIASEYNVSVIVNPAPYQPLPDALLKRVAYLTPNEIEANAMKDDPLFKSIQEKLIITQGEKGVTFFDNEVKQCLSSYHGQVKDTTGAGDTFNGALATEIGKGTSICKAVDFANTAAALSVTKIGAQGGMPTRQEVEQFMKERRT